MMFLTRRSAAAGGLEVEVAALSKVVILRRPSDAVLVAALSKVVILKPA